MFKLHSVGGADKGRFGSLRLIALSGVVAAGLLSAPALAQATGCAFTAPDPATDAEWAEGATATSGAIEFTAGTGGDATLPTVADAANCAGEGDVQYTLFMGGDQLMVASGESSLTLLTIMSTTTNGTVTVTTTGADASNVAAGASVTYTAGDGDFHNAAPVAFVLKAEKAFNAGDTAEFSFTVTVKPTAHGTAPANVRSIAETARSIYVEWTGDGNNSDATATPPTPDTSATHYEVTATPAMGDPVTMRFADTATGTTTTATPDNPRQSGTVMGLMPNTLYTITVKGVSGSGFSERESAASDPTADATDLTADPIVRGATATTMMARESDGEGMAGPFKLSTGEQVDIAVSTLIDLSVGEQAGDTFDAVREGMSFMFAASPGNDAVSVEYIDDNDDDHSDDLIRLVGMGEGTYTVTVTATSGMFMLTATLPVSVIENHTPIFRISEATVDWDIDNTGANFQIDVMANFVSEQITDADAGDCAGNDNADNEINCDHELTFTLTGGAGYLHILEENENAGLITAGSRTDPDLEAVEDGRQFELTVTATDQSGAKDTMKIFVDVIEGNDDPTLAEDAADMYLEPFSASRGRVTETVNLADNFTDREDDDLCYEIASSSLVDDNNTPTDDTDDITLADASLAGASTCMNANLTITMRVPSLDPEDDDFALLGRYGTDTVTVSVRARQRNAADNALPTGTVTVSVDLVYGPNVGPSIRTVAQVTGSGTFVATGTHEIDEMEDIRLTFTADDAQPNGDRLCWSSRGNCTPCEGSEPGAYSPAGWPRPIDIEKRNSNSGAGPVSHEYDLVIRGTERLRVPWTGNFTTRVNTDFERSGGTYTINLCATDLSGATDRLSFEVKINDVEEAPYFTDDFDELYMVVGDYSQEVSIAQKARDGDSPDETLKYAANCIAGCKGAITIAEDDGILRVTPSQDELGDADTHDTVEVEIEVSATDSTGQTAYSKIVVTVKDRNNAPTFADGLTGVSYTVPENSGVGTKIGAPLAITDADANDVLSTEVTGSDRFGSSIVKISEPDEDDRFGIQIAVAKAGLDFESDQNSFDVAVVVEDEYGGSSSIDVRIDLTDKNEPPTKTPGDIADQRILVGLTLCEIKASDHFKDPDHRDQQAGLLIDANSTRPGDASVQVVDNNDICITGNHVGSGPSRIKITATDREGLSVFKNFLVTVEANMPPMVLAEIEDMTAQEGGRIAYDINLNAHFDDGDPTYMEELSYAVDIDDPGDVATGALVGNGSMLRIYGDTKGFANVTVTATDQNGQSISDTFEVQVIRNYAPVADHSAIANHEQYIGKEYDPIDATTAFMDEGDELTYAITTSNPDIATVAIKYDEMGGPWIVAHLHSPGTVHVTMTATDSARQSATVSFELLVHPRNDFPVVANAIADLEIIELRSMDIMLADVFTDDYDTIDIEVVNEDEGVADVVHRMRENLIRVYANAPGMTNVTVTATDDIGQSVVDSFVITVVPNHPPVVANAIPDQSVIVYKSIDISLAGVFSDANDDPLDITAESANEDIATVELMKSSGEASADDHPDEEYVLRITGVSVDSTTIILTATDPGDLSVQHKFEIEVESDKPFVVEGNEIPDQMLDVTMPIMVSIDGVFGDPEDEELTYSVATADEGVATAMIEGTDLTITGVMVGETTGTVTATDPYGNYAMDTFNITVINAGPMVVGEIEDQTLTVVDPAMVDVADAFMDPDGDELTYSATSSNEDAATVSVEGSEVTITGVKVGETMVTVTAMDPAGLYVMTSFMATVENAAPMFVNAVEDQTLTVVAPVSVSVMDTFMDPDGDELTFSATSSNEDAATVSVDGYMVTVTGVKRGETMITVTATDPGGLYAMTTFMATVVNAAPMVANEIDDQTLTVVDPAMVSIADTFMDPDGDEMTYSVMSSNEAAATASLDGTDLMITGVKVGMTTITVTATDPEGLYVMTSFEAEVENAAPQMVGTLDDQVVTRGEPITVSIAGVFMDPDGDPLSYGTASDDASIATASISGESMTVDGLAPGTTSITVTASDPDGLSASGSFSVRVETIPEAVGRIADVTLQVGGDSMTMSIAQYFEDDDGDALTYTVAASGNAATASIAGADLTLAPFTRGSSGITITAADPKGRSVTQSFTANVSDSELRDVAEMALAHHGRAILSATSAAFGSRLEGDRANSGLSFGRFSQYMPLKEGEIATGGNTALSGGGSTFRDVSNASWTGSTSSMSPQATGSASIPNVSNFLNPQSLRNFSHTLNGNGGVGSWSIWGGFDTQTFEGMGYEGDATSLFLGADLQSHQCWLFGVAIANNTGESDYTWGTATQTMETSLTTILPYVRYEPTTGDTSVWGVVGSGSGEAESTVVNADNQTSDLSFTLGLGGIRHDFGETGNFNLAVRADVGVANIETASGDGAIDGLSAGVNRLRAGIEASMNVDPGNGGSLTPFGEVAVRNDGGDGVTGTGLEVAGGVRFSQDAFSFEARGRMTAAHGGEDFSEQGISVVAAFRPSGDGSGLSLSIEPRWGQTTSTTQSFVWNETATIGVGSVLPESNVLRNDNGKSIDTVLGYGFRVGGDRYMFRPFLDVRSGSASGKSTLLGAELKNLVPGPMSIETRFVFGKMDFGESSQSQIGLDARIVF